MNFDFDFDILYLENGTADGALNPTVRNNGPT